MRLVDRIDKYCKNFFKAEIGRPNLTSKWLSLTLSIEKMYSIVSMFSAQGVVISAKIGEGSPTNSSWNVGARITF